MQELAKAQDTNTQIQKYTNTWIIALAMSTRRRILLVFMALSIGCYCYCEYDPSGIYSQLELLLLLPEARHKVVIEQ